MDLLVTGGAGFIGSNFIKYMLEKYDYNIINLDKLTYAGNLKNLEAIQEDPRYTFVKGDICDREVLEDIFSKHQINTIVNFAAESHVDRSIQDSEVFIRTNVMGTQNLLEMAKSHWRVEANNRYKQPFKRGHRYLQISTDEVYGSLEGEGYFTEESNLSPNSPYAASKASADLLVRAYHRTYGLPVIITRCSNNYGPHQHHEKLIPLIIRNALMDRPLPVYGDGRQVRDWLHVADHCRAIDLVLHGGRIGQVYNIGGNNGWENIHLIRLILRHLNKDEKLIRYVEDRLGHDRRYAIDSSKITQELGWEPRVNFEEGIQETVRWYRKQIG